MDIDSNAHPPEELRKLYPSLSDDELKEVAETLNEYWALVWRIYERVKDDPVEYGKFKKILEEWKKGAAGK